MLRKNGIEMKKRELRASTTTVKILKEGVLNPRAKLGGKTIRRKFIQKSCWLYFYVLFLFLFIIYVL